MQFLIDFLQKTIGQKIILGLTGLGLCLYVFIHMLGNLLILSGPSAYNRYAHSLHEFPLFVLLELGLLIFFLLHILLSLLLQIKNKAARGEVSYSHPVKGEKNPALIHRFLWFQGVVLLVFLIFHLWSFKFGPYYETLVEGEVLRDIYKLVSFNFKKPFYTIAYSVVLLVLSLHLLRGIPASFKTLGLSHPRGIVFVERLAILFTAVVVFGFLAPIWYVFIFL